MSGNKKLTVAFDVDGTLIELVGNKEDTPRYKILTLFKLFESFGCEMYIWSGGGVDYAMEWRDKLGLDADVALKGSFIPDIAVDDMETDLGKIDLRV